MAAAAGYRRWQQRGPGIGDSSGSRVSEVAAAGAGYRAVSKG